MDGKQEKHVGKTLSGKLLLRRSYIMYRMSANKYSSTHDDGSDFFLSLCVPRIYIYLGVPSPSQAAAR